MPLSVRARVVLLVVLLVGLASPATTWAQSIGLKAGTGLSRVVFSASFAEDTSLSPGLVGGAFVRVALPWRLSLQVEGLVTEDRVTVAEIQHDRLRYLDVPVLVRCRVYGGGRPIHVAAGAVARRLLDATESVEGESFSITDGVASSDTAVAVGADVRLHDRWSVDVRYVHGRQRLYRRADGSHVGTLRSVQVTAAYALWP